MTTRLFPLAAIKREGNPVRFDNLIIPERNVPMLLKTTSRRRKGERPKKVHLIKVQFNTPITADLARTAVRRAIIAAQAKKFADKATWEAASLLVIEPTVLPIPKPPKVKPAKRVRKAKGRRK